MSITDYKQSRSLNVTQVTVTSDLTGTVYYHWYIDGAYVGVTVNRNTKSFYLETGEQVAIEVIDTNDAAFDPVTGAPDGFPARRTLWWVRSIAADIDHYRVEQNKDGAGYVPIGTVKQTATDWSYSFLTGRLELDTSGVDNYNWRIVPVDTAGNDGASPIVIGAERIIRRADAPNFDMVYNEGAGDTVTFSAVA